MTVGAKNDIVCIFKENVVLLTYSEIKEARIDWACGWDRTGKGRTEF
jgi:hypothetical protein